MTKNKKLEIRLTEEELKTIEQGAASANLKKSDYVRNKLLEQSAYSNNAKEMSKILCDMQTLTNKIYQLGPQEEYMTDLLKEMDSLWQYL